MSSVQNARDGSDAVRKFARGLARDRHPAGRSLAKLSGKDGMATLCAVEAVIRDQWPASAWNCKRLMRMVNCSAAQYFGSSTVMNSGVRSLQFKSRRIQSLTLPRNDWPGMMKDYLDANPRGFVYSANGPYDMGGVIGQALWLQSRTRLPRDRVFVRGYSGGHALYSDPPTASILLKELRKIFEARDIAGHEFRFPGLRCAKRNGD